MEFRGVKESNLLCKFSSRYSSHIFLNSLGGINKSFLIKKKLKEDLNEILIYKKTEKLKLERINLLYKLIQNEKEILILGKRFLKINKNKCRLNINNKINKMKSIINVEN